MFPLSGFNAPEIIPNNVLFPLPLGPVTIVCEPLLILRLRSSKNKFSFPKNLKFTLSKTSRSSVFLLLT